MARHRTCSSEFKRQVAVEHLGREAPLRLSKRPGVSRDLIRRRVAKYEAGELDEDAEAAEVHWIRGPPQRIECGGPSSGARSQGRRPLPSA